MRWRGLSFALAGAMLAGIGALAAPATGQPPSPDPLAQPLRDGCQRDATALIAAQTPEWVYIYNTPPNQPAPAPQWVTGTASSQNPAFQAVHTSGADFAFGHDALDFNLNLIPDPGYEFLMAGSASAKTGNFPGNGEETARLHTEWEDLTVNKSAWPEPGDHVTERGSWVWDCGHWGTPTNIFSPDYDLPHEGQPCPLLPGAPVISDPSQCSITGERSEFHPYRVLWVQRAQSPSSPFGENQADLFVSTDSTRAGSTADCAHKFPPPPSGVLPNPALYGADFRNCVDTAVKWQDVSGDYSFFVPAPARPSGQATLTFRAVDRGSVGAPAPRLTAEGNGVRVTFHLNSAPNQRLVMAYTVFAGWNIVSESALPTHLRVSLDKLEIHRAMDPGCSGKSPASVPLPDCALESTRTTQATTAPGDWNIYWDVGGIWGQWGSGNGELLVQDGDVLKGNRSVDLYVPPGKGWRLFVHGRECDINAVDPTRPLADCPSNNEAADNNDVQGLILAHYGSEGSSLGTHRLNALTKKGDPTSTCPDANSEGCYSITFTVRRIHDVAARAAAVPGGIRLSVSPGAVTAGRRTRFRFIARATTDGSRLGGASIRFAGQTVRTDRRGRAGMTASLRRPGRYRATATKRGLRRGIASVRARKARRGRRRAK
jgi:hypothetical protein